MKSKNVLVVVTKTDQEQINIGNYDFKDCTGINITEHTENQGQDLIGWVKILTDCNVVVTIGSWNENSFLQTLIAITRTLNIEVIHEPNFKKYVEQQNN